MVIVCKWIVPKGFVGITIFPFVFVRKKKHLKKKVLLNHEKIHLRQQAELLIIGFYLWYFISYVVRLIKYREHKKAYKNIVFEREAFAEQKNLNYLETRSFWSFNNY